MKNKILIKVYIPSLDNYFEIFIPTNECIKKVIDLSIKTINNLSDNSLPIDKKYNLFNPETSSFYNNSIIVRDTDIKNGKSLIII